MRVAQIHVHTERLKAGIQDGWTPENAPIRVVWQDLNEAWRVAYGAKVVTYARSVMEVRAPIDVVNTRAILYFQTNAEEVLLDGKWLSTNRSVSLEQDLSG